MLASRTGPDGFPLKTAGMTDGGDYGNDRGGRACGNDRGGRRLAGMTETGRGSLHAAPSQFILTLDGAGCRAGSYSACGGASSPSPRPSPARGEGVKTMREAMIFQDHVSSSREPLNRKGVSSAPVGGVLHSSLSPGGREGQGEGGEMMGEIKWPGETTSNLPQKPGT